MENRIPSTLEYDGRTVNYTGQGRVPGAACFVDAGRGTVLDLFAAEVFSTGDRFSLASVPGNDALDSVYVGRDARNGHGQPDVGERVLIGPVSFPGGKPRARCMWPLRKSRTTGVVVFAADGRNWGKIAEARTGREVFVHASKLHGGAHLVEGARLSFVVVDEPRGPAAHGCRPV